MNPNHLAKEEVRILVPDNESEICNGSERFWHSELMISISKKGIDGLFHMLKLVSSSKEMFDRDMILLRIRNKT